MPEGKSKSPETKKPKFTIGQKVWVLKGNKMEKNWEVGFYEKVRGSIRVIKRDVKTGEELSYETVTERELEDWQVLAQIPETEDAPPPLPETYLKGVPPNIPEREIRAEEIEKQFSEIEEGIAKLKKTKVENKKETPPLPKIPKEIEDMRKLREVTESSKKTLEENNNARNDYFEARKNKKPKKGTLSFDVYEAEIKTKEEAYRTTKNIKVKEFLDKGEKEKAQEFLLGEVELKRKNDLENGLVSKKERIIAGISKGIEKWDNWGKAEGWKGYLQRLAKTGVSMAMIGAISGLSVESLAKIGVGSASAVGGGITSYLGRRVAFGTTISAMMAKIPDNKKKWVSGTLLAGSAGLAVATGGLFAGGALVASSAVGLALSRIVKRYDQKIEKRIKQAKENLINLDALEKNSKEDSQKMEEEMEKVLKDAEKTRIWGKVIQVLTAIAGSTATLELIGFAHHHEVAVTKPHAADLKHEADLKTQPVNPKITHPTVTIPRIMPTPNAHENIINADAIVHKGEGIEHAFIRQIEHDPKLAHALGFTGNSPKELHAFAQHQAHVLARNEGYVDNAGHEVRVAEANKVAYEIKIENGHPIINERMADGRLVETHHAGDPFEQKTESYEYKGSGHHEPIHHDVSHDPAPQNLTVNSKVTENPTAQVSTHRAFTEGGQIKATDRTGVANNDVLINHPEFTNNPFHLPTEKLAQTYEVHQNNLSHIFPKDTRDVWNMVSGGSARKDMLSTPAIDAEEAPFISYLRKLQEVTNLKPKGSFITRDETNGEYIARALQYAAKNNLLNKVKY